MRNELEAKAMISMTATTVIAFSSLLVTVAGA